MSAPSPTTTTTAEEHEMTTTDTRSRTGADGAGATAYLPQIEDVPAAPFTRLLRTELRKLVDTRSGRWLLIAIVVVTVLAMGVALWIGRDSGTEMQPLLLAANVPQTVLIPILGIMTAANEWSQRTALITFTQEPRRLRVMAAKTVAALLLGLAVLAVSTSVATLAHVGSMAVAGGAVDPWIGWPMLGNLVLLQVVGVLMGVAFGALLLSVPFAIVMYFLVPALSPLVFMTTSWLRENAAWLDLGTAQAVLVNDVWPTGEQWAQLGSTTAIWVLLPLAVGCWRIVRREVK